MISNRALGWESIIIHSDWVHRVLNVLRGVLIWVYRYAMMLASPYGHHLRWLTIERAEV